jgi:serine/threonine-protein kinase HipA
MAASILKLLRTYSTGREEDVDMIIVALGFNWLIAGPDTHAKN